MKKRLIVILLTLVLVLSLAACGKGSDFETAQGFIGASAADLAAEIGQPKDTAYANSCLGEGEDGEWYYDGFTVYTYKDTDGTENVYDVMETK